MKENTNVSLVEDDEQTVKAVNDITRSDSDTLLDVNTSSANTIHNSLFMKFKRVIKTPLVLKSILLSTSTVLLVIAIVPQTRLGTLNILGVRAGFEMQVVDETTGQPLKDVGVIVNNTHAQTNEKGVVVLNNLRLGEARVHIEKRGFRIDDFVVTLHVGSNKQARKSLTAIGETYTFNFVQFLTDKPLSGVEVVSGIASALSDEKGIAKVVVPAEDIVVDKPMSFVVKVDGFREETISLTKDQKDNSYQLVPNKKRVFVSKRDGTIDIYTSYLDGKEEKMLLKGSGIERDDVKLLAPEAGTQVAFVASRENVKDQYGYIMNTLYFVDIDSGSIVKIDQASDIQLLGWGNSDTLVYSTSVTGTSAGSSDRQKILSVSGLTPGVKKELARANGFYDMRLVRDMVYYSPFNYGSAASAEKGVFRVSLDGLNRSKIYDKEAYTLVRTGYATIAFDSEGKWYEYDTHRLVSPAARTHPSQSPSVKYVDDTELGMMAWSEERDGLGVVFVQMNGANEPEAIARQSTITGDIYWFNAQYIMYRNNTGRSHYETVQSIDSHRTFDLPNIHPYTLTR